VRVLFSCNAADGHLLPLVPLARAFEERGDAVAVATAAGYADRAASFGFDVLPAGLDTQQLAERLAPRRPQLEGVPFEHRRAFMYSWRFAEVDAPAKVDALLAGARTWKPDLLIHDTTDLAGPAVAAALGIPSTHHSFGLVLPPECLERAVEAIAPVWRALGLEADPFAGLYRGTYVDVCPPSLQSDAPPDGTPVLTLRVIDVGAGDPVWRARLPEDRPVVYATLGTLSNDPERLQLLVTALAGVEATVVMTVGAGHDPASVGPLPADAIVVRYIPQDDLLPLVDAVVCHAGSGSTFGALAYALPLVLLPAAADQFDNARACAGAGAAITLLPSEVHASSVRDAAAAVLANPTYGAAAARISAEFEAMRSPAEIAQALSL